MQISLLMHIIWRSCALLFTAAYLVYSPPVIASVPKEACNQALSAPLETDFIFSEATTVEEALVRLESIDISSVFEKANPAELGLLRNGLLVNVYFSREILIPVKLEDRQLTVPVSADSHVPGIYRREVGNGNHDVSLLVNTEDVFAQVLVQVSANMISPLSRHRAQTNHLLRAFKPRSFSFFTGDLVRFRDKYGKVKVGKWFEKAKGLHHISYGGEMRKVSSSFVWHFFSNTEIPFTPNLESANKYLNQESYDILDDNTFRSYLSEANKLTSLPDFWSQPRIEQLKSLNRFQNMFLNYNLIAATGVEVFGMRPRLGDIINCGISVCRHMAYLMAHILAESGYTFRLMVAVNNRLESLNSGHMWLEVDLNVNGKVDTYVFDPTNNVVRSLEESSEIASQNPESIDALFYTHPNRQAHTGK